MSAEHSYDDLDDATELDDDLFETSDDDELDDLDELSEGRDIIRAKWSMDGARTLSEAAAKLEAFAQELRDLEESGWQLTEPVADDVGIIEDGSG
ncbi:hypothetical protein KZX45_07275 [Georgenia sp. EYE_87]|uniref:hypothetical protein n=1 Tax=Georgenia sp. EYE_87 TaxID=2853448 RepID=UPI002003FE30|nr:hypothetical protein [Georgenia sp. EYE_87]MCK6210343.1 hypothetical protein [Georgenia sp. EYE_87]